jgi:uncharacterized protein (TIGR02246 family)
MLDDEQAIRGLYATWQRATTAGDLSLLLSLMADDVVFLEAGRPPIRGKAEFAALARAAGDQFRIRSRTEFGELMIHGDWAHAWCQLSVTMTPLGGGTPVHRSGYTLTILQKRADGSWVVARDANMLTPDPDPRGES